VPPRPSSLSQPRQPWPLRWPVFCLTVTQESGNLWRYNLSEQKNTRLAYGKIIVPGHIAALRRAAEICADGYQPGSIERGLLEQFAADHTGS
jgi:hypothetical protein